MTKAAIAPTVQLDKIPEELKRRKRWVLWKYKERKGSKPAKPPYQVSGKNASVSDPTSWSSFYEVVAEYQLDTTKYHGLGFVLGEGVVGIDLDDCIDSAGTIQPWAQDILDNVESYAEYSPSGEGLHLFAMVTEGSLPKNGRKKHIPGSKGHFEIYDCNRYFTITGAIIDGRQNIIDQTAAVKAVYDQQFPPDEHSTEPELASTADQEVLDKIYADEKSERLWEGDISDYHGDHSKADLALCNLLARLTQGDKDQIDRLFRASNLMRPKWERDDYREWTLEKAILGQEPQVTRMQISIRNLPRGVPNPSKEVLLRYGADDAGNAETVAAIYNNHFLHVNALGWLQWTGTHWESQDGEKSVDRAIIAVLRARAAVAAAQGDSGTAVRKVSTPNAFRVRSCKSLLKAYLTASISELDKGLELLNVANGVLNLKTGELSPSAPTYKFTYCLPVEYDPNADRSLWLSFLDDTLSGAQDLIEYLKKAVGYSLTGDIREEKMWYIYGPTRSGKGTFTETLQAMLGNPLSTECSFDTFTSKVQQNFDLAPLKPARLVIASETGTYDKLKEDKIKQLTGGNPIQAAFKGKTAFVYRPQFKIWLVSNQPPRADVDDEAVWGRLRVIHFPNSYLGREDKTLKLRLRKPENLKGVLAWAVEGAVEWYKEGRSGLETPKQVEEHGQAARDEEDFVKEWITERLIFTLPAEDRAAIARGEKKAPSKEHYVSYKALYENYIEWCEEQGVTPKQKRTFATALSAKGIPQANEGKVIRLGGKICKCRAGVKIARKGMKQAISELNDRLS